MLNRNVVNIATYILLYVAMLQKDLLLDQNQTVITSKPVFSSHLNIGTKVKFFSVYSTFGNYKNHLQLFQLLMLLVVSIFYYGKMLRGILVTSTCAEEVCYLTVSSKAHWLQVRNESL